jgi:exopolysaccharide biosynthesis polyprenyl glycosylphosphotransferase
MESSVLRREVVLPQQTEVVRHGRARRGLVILDALAGCFAILVMFALMQSRSMQQERKEVALLIAVLVTLFALVVLVRSGQYNGSRRFSRVADTGSVTKALMLAGAVVLVLNFLTKGFFTGTSDPSRLAVGLFFVTFFVLAVVSRFSLWALQRRRFLNGYPLRSLLVVGEGRTADDFYQFVAKRPWLGVSIAGRLSTPNPVRQEPEAVGPKPSPKPPLLGSLTSDINGLRELDRALASTGAQELVIALEPEDQLGLQRVTNLLSLAHVPFKIVPSLFEQSYRATELLGYAELPVIDVEVDALDRVSRLIKRGLDLAAALGLLILLLPLEVLIIAGIALDSGFPIIYRQERVGKHGRRFQVYKFRTMVRNADQLKAALESSNEAGPGGQIFKMRRDPRVTRVGAVLRKLSLDELPQLVNVVKKEMSLVGPRPPLPAEVERYEQEHLIRLKALPGITGLWQVSGRSELSFEDMVRLDRYYTDNWSLRLDLSIILKTVPAVLGRSGAY